MAILSWLNSFAVVVLSFVSVVLYLDARGARKALAAVSRRVSGHDTALAAQGLRLDTLAHHLGGVDARHGGAVADLELRTGQRIGEVGAALGAVQRIVARLVEGAPLPVLVPGSPYRAPPPREARERRTPPNPSAPPVDMTDDRPGINPDAPVTAGSPVPPPSSPRRAAPVAHDKLRLRLLAEAAEDQRDRDRAARAPLAAPIPRAEDSEDGSHGTWEERTKVFPGRLRSDAPTVVGGIAPEQRDSDGETRLMELPVGWSGKGPIPPKDAANVGRSFSGPWVEETQLSAGTLDEIDRLAAERGTTREAMAADLARTGIEAEERRAAGPTTPPSGPANDAPPPSGKRRV